MIELLCEFVCFTIQISLGSGTLPTPISPTRTETPGAQGDATRHQYKPLTNEEKSSYYIVGFSCVDSVFVYPINSYIAQLTGHYTSVLNQYTEAMIVLVGFISPNETNDT